MTDVAILAPESNAARGVEPLGDGAAGAVPIRMMPANVLVMGEQGQSVLDAALSAGYFPRHSCRRGECGICSARLVEGQVAYPAGFLPQGLPEGHCLTCMARPVGEVVIEAPEVLPEPGRRVVQVGARVASVERVSHDVCVVRLQVPPQSGLDFAPGQYCDVVLRDGTRRSYSMANLPDGSGILEWHIRALPRGRFSTHVYKVLKPRDMLRVEGPYGAFQLSASDKPAILLASGTGYAPIASIMRAHDAALRERGAKLYWGGRRLEDLYAYQQACDWAATWPEFEFIPVLSDPQPGWTGRTGFVHEAVAQDLGRMEDVEVYACGNPLMVDAARVVFVRDHGLPARAFYSDAFITAVNGRDAAGANRAGDGCAK